MITADQGTALQLDGWDIACPECRTSLAGDGRCPACRTEYRETDGVWELLGADRASRYAPFLADYAAIRAAEGRGSEDPEYYRRLPDHDPAHPLAWQWAIRRKSFETLRQHVVAGLPDGARILDLGAGNGWLSHRLALAGHRPCAVDINTDPADGLRAARHFEPSWPRLRAEFDRLPLAAAQADLVIYNASFHYAADAVATLREALRVLRPRGRVVILDTPLYHHDAAGRQMVAEKHAGFEAKYGTRSDHLSCLEYLTWDGLRALGGEVGLRFTWKVPWYGWRWALRPWRAKLRRQREPSRFAVVVGSRA